MSFLAQISSPSPEFFGTVVLSLILLTRWLWDYNRHRRDEEQQHEPRAVPALHLTYATKAEHSDLKAKVGEVERKVDENYRALESKRSVSVAQLHEKLQEQTEALNQRIDAVPERTIELLLSARELARK